MGFLRLDLSFMYVYVWFCFCMNNDFSGNE